MSKKHCLWMLLSWNICGDLHSLSKLVQVSVGVCGFFVCEICPDFNTVSQSTVPQWSQVCFLSLSSLLYNMSSELHPYNTAIILA